MTEPVETLRAAFLRRQPDFPLLAIDRPEATESFLRERSWIARDERFLDATRAGEGNMNLTLRIRTDRGSVILKQSRPWVEKYDWIEAPFERALLEQRFYERLQSLPRVAAKMPRLLAADPGARALLFEDLGADEGTAVADFTSLYGSDTASADEIRALGGYLRDLHRETRGGFDESLANREMRALNHEHIFCVPLVENNGVKLGDLEEGLERVAARLRTDPELARRVADLGERYLADGECLLHGDFFPGSWLRLPGGPKVIDPEFCFFGDPEFDIGVGVAHLVLADQPRELCSLLIETAGGADRSDGLIARFAGVEVVRRLIGVAQLPLPPGRGRRATLLERARLVVLEQTLEPFFDD